MSQDRRHPPSTYGARYPKNRVMVTESGHELHWDDTKGRERIRLAHRSGTYTEMSHDGKRVDMVVGHHLTYVKGGSTVTVDKNHDVKVGGSTRTSVSGDSHSEVRGTVSQAVQGGVVSSVGGDFAAAINGDTAVGLTGSVTLKMGGGMKAKADGSAVMAIGDTLVIEAASRIRLQVGGSYIDITPGLIRGESSRIEWN